MAKRKSRYAKTRGFTYDDDTAPFTGMRPREIKTADGVLEHRVKAWERLDLLSLHYYNNDRMWWRMLDANPDILYPGDALTIDSAGEILIVPRAADKKK